MHHYRHVLSRMRLGETDRAIARAGLMGRRKIAQFRQIALKLGWLDPALPLPEDAELSRHVQASKEDHLLPSLVEPYSDEVVSWIKDGVQGTTIHSALVRKYGFQGSYSSVRRFLAQFKTEHPQMTTILDFEPGEAAQVDFGKGPTIIDVYTGEILSTWVFVMTLAYSRHHYAQIVTDQKVGTWLGCHRRALSFLMGFLNASLSTIPSAPLSKPASMTLPCNALTQSMPRAMDSSSHRARSGIQERRGAWSQGSSTSKGIFSLCGSFVLWSMATISSNSGSWVKRATASTAPPSSGL